MKRREFIALLGGGVAWPLVARAEQLTRVTLGKGRNLTVIHRAPKKDNSELPELANESVALKPDVLAAISTPPVMALKKSTTAIPVVMVAIGNPVATGLVQSLSHPGGNVTGTANDVDEWGVKHFEMIRELLPNIRCVTFFENAMNPATTAIVPSLSLGST